MSETQRKPRIALMGEFSAGKSTLSNLLLGARPLPEKVTATQLPPVWLSYGTGDAYREGLDGTKYSISLDNLEEIPLSETRLVRIFMESDILEVCDLIDMPGISDPNMASEVWERTIHLADSVLWCTHATQAWRQSEAAVWDSLPQHLHETSLLLITRFDKIMTEKDRVRVLKRVGSETQGKFASFYPISLTRAIAAGEDHKKWVASGADALTDGLVDLIQRLSSNVLATAPEDAPAVADAPIVQPKRKATLRVTAVAPPAEAPAEQPEKTPLRRATDVLPEDELLFVRPASTAKSEASPTDGAKAVLPKRVRAETSRTQRPQRPDRGSNAELLTKRPPPAPEVDAPAPNLDGLREALSDDSVKRA